MILEAISHVCLKIDSVISSQCVVPQIITSSNLMLEIKIDYTHCGFEHISQLLVVMLLFVQESSLHTIYILCLVYHFGKNKDFLEFQWLCSCLCCSCVTMLVLGLEFQFLESAFIYVTH